MGYYNFPGLRIRRSNLRPWFASTWFPFSYWFWISCSSIPWTQIVADNAYVIFVVPTQFFLPTAASAQTTLVMLHTIFQSPDLWSRRYAAIGLFLRSRILSLQSALILVLYLGTLSYLSAHTSLVHRLTPWSIFQNLSVGRRHITSVTSNATPPTDPQVYQLQVVDSTATSFVCLVLALSVTICRHCCCGLLLETLQSPEPHLLITTKTLLVDRTSSVVVTTLPYMPFTAHAWDRINNICSRLRISSSACLTFGNYNAGGVFSVWSGLNFSKTGITSGHSRCFTPTMTDTIVSDLYIFTVGNPGSRNVTS